MSSSSYPPGTIRNLFETDLLTRPTKRVLEERLALPEKAVPDFFTVPAFRTLIAVSSRLIPQNEGQPRVDLAGLLDSSLASGYGDGWRYDAMPPDETSFRLGINGIEESALEQFGRSFTDLDASGMDAVLMAVQAGEVKGETWQVVSPVRFFEELLAALTELYFSHPLGREEIGDMSIADARGWNDVG